MFAGKLREAEVPDHKITGWGKAAASRCRRWAKIDREGGVIGKWGLGLDSGIGDVEED